MATIKTIQRTIAFLGGLSAVGNITTLGTLSAGNGSSTQWNNVWTTVNANSGAWSAGGGGGAADWTYIANKPTTLAGYGITDAAPSSLTTVVASNSSTWGDKSFSSITGKPTTLAGYGITDATSSGLTTFVSANSSTWADKAFSSITGTPTTLAGYGITDAASSTLTTLVASNSATWGAPTFASITSKPTTLVEYGITDAAPISLNTLVQNNSSTWSDQYWSSIMGKPTTLAGYGITDAASTSYVNTNFIPVSGGTITGSLSVLGTTTYVDTNVAVTSAMYIDTSSTETALRVTQSGSGDAIRVEDSTNPDTTPFIVKSDGLVGIGTADPNEKLTVVGNVSATAYQGDSYKATSSSVNAQTGTSYTLLTSDNGKIITMDNASASTVTVPSGLGAGFSCTLVQIGAGQVTVVASGVTINSYQGYTKIAGQHAGASLFAYSANVFNLNGSLA